MQVALIDNMQDCQGCGGLNDQSKTLESTAKIDPFASALLSILDDEEENVESDPQDVNESWIDRDDLDDEVLRLFPELQEFIEEPGTDTINTGDETQGKIRRVESVQHRDKYSVYMGRCGRCKGYMTNDIECHDGIKDDDIYRCFTCGWRTSPVYQWNRNNNGGV
jgi:hypothetical protein